MGYLVALLIYEFSYWFQMCCYTKATRTDICFIGLKPPQPVPTFVKWMPPPLLSHSLEDGYFKAHLSGNQ